MMWEHRMNQQELHLPTQNKQKATPHIIAWSTPQIAAAAAAAAAVGCAPA